jgi:hypothetical protein
MITVTPGACAVLADLLEEAGVQPHLVLRVVADESGKLDLSLESPQLEDTVFNFRGRNVLALEPVATQILADTSLDL